MRPQQFRKQVLDVIKRHQERAKETNSWRDLKTYLLALWGLVERDHSAGIEPTWERIVVMLDEAFTAEPAAFDESWLDAYDDSLWWEKEGDEYVFIDYVDRKKVIAERDVEPFRILKHTLLFQIADFHRLLEKGVMHNEYRYFGVESPTGNSWYNFDPFTYVECATAGMADTSSGPVSEIEIRNPDAEPEDDETQTPSGGCDWAELARLLELGRLYE